MRTISWTLTVLSLVPMAAAQGQEKPPVAEAYLELQGAVLGRVSDINAGITAATTREYVESVRKSGQRIPEQTTALLAAAQTAFESRDYYRAFRLYARAAGWTRGQEQVEGFEVAASLQMYLNQAMFAEGETITLSLRPLFTLGHPLAGSYAIQSWIETPDGKISGTERKAALAELRELRFDYPAARLQDGVIAVGYRLTSASGETLAEFRRAVLIAKDAPKRTERLKGTMAAVRARVTSGPSEALRSALDTIEYNLQNLELERTTFEKDWQREVHPLAAYLGLRADPVHSGWRKFPEFRGRLRYPQDVDFTESLAGAIGADPQALLKMSGDMALAYRTTGGELIRYRIFVPNGYDRARKYSLVVALNSGEGDSFYFDNEAVLSGETGPNHQNRLKQLAQERGYIVVVPNGGKAWFSGERGAADVVDLAERARRVYSIETRRVFLAGWSGGGESSWQIAIANPEHFGGSAPVGSEARWLTRENTAKARTLPVFYSVAETEASRAQRTAALAKDLLSNFTYKEYPGTEHGSVWYAALPAMFDFFDKQGTAAAQGQLQ